MFRVLPPFCSAYHAQPGTAAATRVVEGVEQDEDVGIEVIWRPGKTFGALEIRSIDAPFGPTPHIDGPTLG